MTAVMPESFKQQAKSKPTRLLSGITARDTMNTD